MGINNIHYASRAMSVAFKITTKMVGKSDKRRAEIRATAKLLIERAENCMILAGVKHNAGIESKPTEK